MSEPTTKSKVILQDFANDETFWFESADKAAEYLTRMGMVDPEDYTCYELGKEITFKVVPT